MSLGKMRKLGLAVFLVSALLARAATASSIRCTGEMRLSDCRPVTQDEYDWPPSSQPTFSVECIGCPSPNPTDAGPPQTCMPWPPQTGEFVLSVAGQTYRNPGPVRGDQKIYFEETGSSCDGRSLFRYKGPLQPGMKHQIELGGHDYPKAPITFHVAQAPTGDPPMEAGTDTGRFPAPGAPSEENAGCSCSLGRSGLPSSSTPLALLVAALLVAIRRRR
jgi:MYXO-CTERM domain-containing protein